MKIENLNIMYIAFAITTEVVVLVRNPITFFCWQVVLGE